MDHSSSAPADLEGRNRQLSAKPLALQNCYITEVLAFPRSLAVCQGGLLEWNATCWLETFPIPQLTIRKIADYCNIRLLHKNQICEFKGSSSSDEHLSVIPDIRILVVFPHMKSFKSKKVQQIWTDKIVLPSLYRHLSSSILRYAPTSYELLRLNSEAMRVEALHDVGDTPCCFVFQSDNLEGIWEDIVKKTLEDGLEQFRDLFLVAIGKWHPTFTLEDSIEGAWKKVANVWDSAMDMDYIPAETLEVRMESQFGLRS